MAHCCDWFGCRGFRGTLLPLRPADRPADGAVNVLWSGFGAGEVDWYAGSPPVVEAYAE